MNDRKTRLKNAERVKNYENRRRRSASGVIQDPPSTGNSWQTLKPLLGDCPPITEASCWVCDSFEKKAYMIGGRLPTDDSFTPTTDVYCLGLTSMRWKNMTVTSN